MTKDRERKKRKRRYARAAAHATAQELAGSAGVPSHSMRPCIVCSAKPTVADTGLCGPCCFGEAETVNGNW